MYRVIKVFGVLPELRTRVNLSLPEQVIFYMSAKDINALTICPFHRSELGTGWRRSQNTCRIPDEIASHGKGKGVKGDRCASRAISKVIFQITGILVPLGSGVAFMNPIAKKIIVV